jgi:3-deoxy-D-manno-octulosonic-acid transferase
MRLLYTLTWGLSLPLAFAYLGWRALRQPDYLGHWGERLGRIDFEADGRPVIWLHAVSVGETRASAPLIDALLTRHPDSRVLLTHATPTGRATGQALFGDRVRQAYLPYDLPWLVARFLDRVRPSLGIIMETEIWPNLFQACRSREIPLYLVNCRLSERSARGYGRFPSLVGQALACLSGIAAQTGADAARLAGLGASAITVTGNLKFDIPGHSAGSEAVRFRQRIGDRFVWLAASTRDGEERIVLEAWEQLDRPDILLVVVPRHPQRFDEVARLLQDSDPALVRRSEQRDVPTSSRIVLGDSMGEMAMYYASCDVAFIGGSLLPYGGQNLIEAAAAGKPALIGPHTWNFEQAAEQAVAAGAAYRVGNAKELADAVRRLQADALQRSAMGQAGLDFAAAHRGATERVLDVLAPALTGLT